MFRAEKTLGIRKFDSLLLSSVIEYIVIILVLLSDTIIIGNIIGEEGISGMNLVVPLIGAVNFISIMISVGISTLYSQAIGAFDKDKAGQVFGMGIMLSSAVGIFFLISTTLLKAPYFNFFEVDALLREKGEAYFYFSRFVWLILPVQQLFADLVYCDGDGNICVAATVIQVVGNIFFSIFFTMRMGIAGAGLGTLCGVILGLMTYCLHLFRKSSSMRAKWFFAWDKVAAVVKYGFTDSSIYIFLALFNFIITRFIIWRFGEVYIPVFVVVCSIFEIMLVFDGIGQALKSLQIIYQEENNTVAIRSLMVHAFKVAFVMGVAVMVLLLAIAPFVPVAFDITDARLVLLSTRAVRIMALAAVPMSLTYLLTSYYLYQEHFVFSILGTAFSNFFFQTLLAVPFGLIWGLGGVWTGISAGIYLGLAVLLLLVLLQYGKADFPLLLFDQDRVIKDFNFDLTSESIVSVRNKANEFLAANNVSYKNINLVDLAIEEIFMLVLEMNKGKRLMGECTLNITDRIELIVWDDGQIFDITDTDQQITSLRKYVVANIMQYIKEKKTITATGLNRNAFSFVFDK